MVIAGLQKMTLLDYPGKVACTVFLQGCNFRCPFCHNRDLLGGNGPDRIEVEELLAFLRKRQGLLDAVCITGGEPTLQPDLADLIRSIKALGFAVKLDTNGSRPQVLQQLVEEGLLDYIAMDVKNGPSHYAATTGTDLSLDPIEQSLRFLLSDAVDYELRTTVVAELHSEASVLEMGQWLSRLTPDRKARRFFLQAYVDRDSVLCDGLHAPSDETLAKYKQLLAPYVADIRIRGQN